ncbi:gtpase-activating protein [Gossypium australe]|uniref:Gtpase-activating protein n=1 Tax=Gossypium australe TaxID=47621 RepID=A0A5B6V683_9ROSI|nr:gtpase-activating protein [Gossypium australe]
MNFFAGLLLLMMPEENAFWTLVGIIDDYFDGYYTEEMIESQVDQLVFEELMRERFPKLGSSHLDYLGVQVTWLSAPWFFFIFINILPWESEIVFTLKWIPLSLVLRIWDVILFEGNRVMLFRTALALIELYGPALVTTKDAGDAITLLQSLAGSTFDSSQLVLTSCMGFLSVTNAKLYELSEKYRPDVLLIVEERTKTGRQVWKDSKGLASKLYNFKHDHESLMEERKSAKGSADGDASKSEPRSSYLEELLSSLSADSEVDSLPDLQDRVGWMKVELFRLLEEKRAAVLRAEELETALVELVKEDNRRELSAKIEELEQEVLDLRQGLADKKEQEAAVHKVLMQLEQEQLITEDARKHAEQDAAEERNAVIVLQEKYEKAMASIALMEDRVAMAESILEATMQSEPGLTKVPSPPQTQLDSARRKVEGLLSFGLKWRDKSKGKSEESNSSTQDRENPGHG